MKSLFSFPVCRPALAGFIISPDSERGFAMSTLFVYFPNGKTKGYTGVESTLKIEGGVLTFYSQPERQKNVREKIRKKVQTSLPFLFEQPNLGKADENHLYFDPGDGRLLTVFTNEGRADARRPGGCRARSRPGSAPPPGRCPAACNAGDPADSPDPAARKHRRP